jgi:hypothetical protein
MLVTTRSCPDTRLWRITLLTFLHVIKNDAWKQEMIRFLNLLSEALGEALLEKNIMAFKVAREVLRLYPSTKQVYRKFQLEGETETKEYTADMEASHHDRAV